MESKCCPQCGAPLPAGALEGLCPACLLQQGAADTGTQPEAAAFQPPSLEEMARLFPQLEIQSLIGKGGMGAVYKARQPSLDRLVALKILPPQVASGPGFAERFNREARALAKLSHPNIVAVHEFGQVNGLPFFIMEFVDGLNLRQLERAGKLSPREALQIVPQICEALQFAHDEGVVHRDIKPENILLDRKGRVKIADFGIAKIMGAKVEPGITEPSAAVGTPQYMAPEQVEKPESVDHRADIFSLGVVFYEMLTGELPLGKFAPPSRKVDVDVRLDDVVLRALEKEPERRYQHASQVRTDVDTITGKVPPPPENAAEAMAQEILARDYVLDIGSCLRRGWALVKADFWVIVGISALMLLLVQAATSTAVGIVAGGPLMGGLWLYLLKCVRGEAVSLETAFSGFRIAFVDLFLAGFLTCVLTLLGFICLIVPGVYLAVAWMFALILVIDLRLRFWPAMELSRKVVTRHWLKFFGFALVLLLMNVVGFLVCVVGVFFTAPITLAATVFAYEDIFGVTRRTAQGTAISPAQPAQPSNHGRGVWKPIAAGLALLLLFFLIIGAMRAKARRLAEYEAWSAEQAAMQAVQAAPDYVFGPVLERVLEFTNADRRALNLASGSFVRSTPDRPVDFGPDEAGSLRQAGVDLYLSDAAVEAFRNKASDEAAQAQLSALDFRVLTALLDDGSRPLNDISNVGNAPVQAVSLESDVPPSPDQTLSGNNVLSMVTRDGTKGLLQIGGLTEDPPGAKVRYRLLKYEPGPGGAPRFSRESLVERMEAANGINSTRERCRSFARLAVDTAKIGEMELLRQSLEGVTESSARDQTALECARVLARSHLRKQAIEIAKTIIRADLRDQALSELAQ